MNALHECALTSIGKFQLILDIIINVGLGLSLSNLDIVPLNSVHVIMHFIRNTNGTYTSPASCILVRNATPSYFCNLSLIKYRKATVSASDT